jgi:4-hydroxy 2-oxovalerate aldolase
MPGTLQVLDCTLRDGGQGLEDLNSNGIKTESFTDNDKYRIAELIRDSGIDIIEIGCMSEASQGLERFAIYENIEKLSKFLPKRTNPNQIYTGLYIDPDTPIDRIPDYTPELVEGIRVILRYSQLQQSIDFCSALAKKGYKTFIQPMLTMRYTDEELKRLVYAANEMGAYALYFVDSFGYMNEKDVERLYRYYSEELDPAVRIGFHAHNNMENALFNARYFVEKLNDRNRIVDSCAIGMGQGAGNLQTEILVNHLNKNLNTNYDFDCILEVCDILDKFRGHDMETWGYSPVRLIPAVHDVAYKYAVTMKLQYNMSLVDINRTLKGISDDLRHRYSPDNLKKLLNN